MVRLGSSRWWTIGLIVGGLAVVMTGTWFLASSFASPQQVAAAASPPPPEVIYAEVTQGDLKELRSAAGSVEYAGLVELVPMAVPEATRSVITQSFVEAGDSVNEGTALFALNDRPVFFLSSPFPLYRDLREGDSGVDVIQLQEALVSQGLLATADGDFGARTAVAVCKLFGRVGFEAPRSPKPAEEDPLATGLGSTGTEAKTDGGTSCSFPVTASVTADVGSAVVRSAPSVGWQADGPEPALSLTSSNVVIRTALPAGYTAETLTGVPVTVSVPGKGTFDAVVVPSAPATPETEENDGQEDDSPTPNGGAENGENDGGTVLLASDALSESGGEFVGSAATVTFTVQTLATSALIVPAAAVAESSATTGRVEIEDEDGELEQVRVKILGVSNGYVAIDSDNELIRPGARVRVG